MMMMMMRMRMAKGKGKRKGEGEDESAETGYDCVLCREPILVNEPACYVGHVKYTPSFWAVNTSAILHHCHGILCCGGDGGAERGREKREGVLEGVALSEEGWWKERAVGEAKVRSGVDAALISIQHEKKKDKEREKNQHKNIWT
jgi:hypothetical protein